MTRPVSELRTHRPAPAGHSRTRPIRLGALWCYARRVGRFAIIAAIAASVTAACGADDPAPGEPNDAAPPTRPPPDAGSADRPAAQPADASGPADDPHDPTRPTSEEWTLDDDYHLDEPATSTPVLPQPQAEPAERIDLTLRSTPSGADVLVDGEPIGETPAHWRGTADGSAREITFVRPGFEMARYRFVPTQSGIVHATLDRLAGAGALDAGSPEPDEAEAGDAPSP